ncbi:MAG: EAL domain-containing protein [Nitrospirae bacterium]|nr:EAL domain-containing protein [Nitrospirota bacterium]
MKLKATKNRSSISKKIIVLTSALIVLTSLVIAVFNIRTEIVHSYKEVLEKGNSLAVIMAENSEYAVYTENLEALQQIVKSLETNPEIIYVRIYNRDKNVLAHKAKNTSGNPQQGKDSRKADLFPDNIRQNISTHQENHIDIIAPIVSAQKEFQNLLFTGEKRDGKQKIIGYLQIGLTLDEARNKTNSFVFSTVLFTALFVVFGIVLAIYLAKKITSPINELSLVTQEIAAGKFDRCVDIRTNDEIADFAGSFNNMLSSLKAYRCQVEARTHELSITNEKLIDEIRVRQETEISLAATKIRLQHLLSNTPAVIYSCKPYREFVVTFMSENIKSLLGYGYREFLEDPQKWAVCVHRDDVWQFLNERERIFDRGQHSMEYRFMRDDGRYVWLYDELRLIRDSEGVPVEIVGYLIDVTNRRMLEEQLINDALHDPLTGLPNRALFQDRLDYAIVNAKQITGSLFCVLFLDVDRFKKVNDSLGHVIGDKLLVAVAKRLRNCIHKNDTVARLGGDEFAIILSNIKGIHDAETVSERIHKEMSVPFNIEGQEIYLSVSIGIAINDKEYDCTEQFLRDADTAMYHAKRKGGGCHVLFDTSMHELAVKFLRMETDLQHAIERDEMFLEYQPIISVKTGKIEGFEALLRWRHPEHGLITPLEFIPVAEETGLIVRIGNWVLHEACRQMRLWQEEFSSDFPLTISVNISGKQFAPQLIQYIKRVLRETGLDSNSLILEITETVIMDNPEATAKLLMKLKEMNVRLQIDDFGTGYSSLNYLQHFPVDALKIDKSFIQLMNDNEDKLEIVKLIVTLAHNLYMNVIAEGVETVEQYNLLCNLQCGYVQGFLFSRPLKVKDVETVLRQGQTAI